MTKKVVFITGGTSGIGLALAEAFLRTGASVAVCARSRTALENFRAAHPQALAIEADVTDVSAQYTALNAVAERFQRLDILVNNAGRLIERDFAHEVQTPTALADDITLNLIAPIQLTAATLARWPSLEAIVLVSSGYALVSPRRAPTYGAAKAGLHGFADGLRRQLADRGTQVVEVLPPTVDTPATVHSKAKKIAPADVAAATLEALEKRRPMALVGQTKLLPMMLRLAPRTVQRMVAEA
ncbi:MAG TPA: SDR family NAD(P)-dependent oxidoreductase [Acidisphaera sp.]|nr:SDR family NAD(P)-dependent oxidoreductase [Acidisphaera sp.]